MVARIEVFVWVVGLVLAVGCRREPAEAEPIVPVGEEGAQALQLGDVIVVDNRGETPLLPLGEPPAPGAIWDRLGVTPAGGDVTSTRDHFRRIEDPAAAAPAMVAAYVQQLAGHGWAQQTGNDPLRVELDREGLKLSLVGNELAGGGAGIGFSLAQDWAALGLPPGGAAMSASGPADCHATFMQGQTTPAVMGPVEALLVAAGWTHAVEELTSTRDGIRDVAVRWYVRGERSLRVQVHSQDDGTVQLRVDAAWRQVPPAGAPDGGSP
jgi:hypothetical protein